MKTNKQIGFVRKARWVLGAAVLSLAFAANAAGELELSNAVYQDMEVQTEDGRTEVRQVPASRVIPGTEVTYVISYRNVGDGPVEDVAITNPVPPQLSFVEPNGTIDVTAYSVDQGEAYGALADLTVPGPDGQPRPALPSDVTHLRWTLPVLAPGAEGAVSFTARVR